MKKKTSVAKYFIYAILGILLLFGLKFITQKQTTEFDMYIRFLGTFMPYMGILMTLVSLGRAFKNSKWSNTNEHEQ
jgi:SNF family Na+-dependent transporter